MDIRLIKLDPQGLNACARLDSTEKERALYSLRRVENYNLQQLRALGMLVYRYEKFSPLFFKIFEAVAKMEEAEIGCPRRHDAVGKPLMIGSKVYSVSRWLLEHGFGCGVGVFRGTDERGRPLVTTEDGVTLWSLWEHLFVDKEDGLKIWLNPPEEGKNNGELT